MLFTFLAELCNKINFLLPSVIHWPNRQFLFASSEHFVRELISVVTKAKICLQIDVNILSIIDSTKANICCGLCVAECIALVESYLYAGYLGSDTSDTSQRYSINTFYFHGLEKYRGLSLTDIQRIITHRLTLFRCGHNDIKNLYTAARAHCTFCLFYEVAGMSYKKFTQSAKG